MMIGCKQLSSIAVTFLLLLGQYLGGVPYLTLPYLTLLLFLLLTYDCVVYVITIIYDWMDGK